MSDRRKTGEGAMKGWKTRRSRMLSHGDLCHLSRTFNRTASLRETRDQRINEWLRRQIARRALAGEQEKMG